MFVVGLASLSIVSPDQVLAALRVALQRYQGSSYHELGPAASAAARVKREQGKKI